MRRPVSLLEMPVAGGKQDETRVGEAGRLPTAVLCWVHVGLRVALTLHGLTLQSPFPLQITA